MRIYLDNCCYNRPYDDQMQLRISLETQAKLFVQDLIRNNQIELAASYMPMYENEQNPYEMKKYAIRNFVQDNTSVYIGYDKSEEVSVIASQIAATGIKAKDAIHVASAILAACDYFLTTDIRLLKYQSKRISLLNPVDFIQYWEEHTDG